MKVLRNELEKIEFFNYLSNEEIEDFINSEHYHLEYYEKDKFIRFKGSYFENALFLIEGSVNIEMVHEDGRVIVVDNISEPKFLIFGYVFNNSKSLPAHIVAVKETKILVLSKEIIMKMCKEKEEILGYVFSELGKKMQNLSKKIWFNTMKSIKAKFCSFINEQIIRQGNINEITINITIEELSKHFGIARPSLSRAIAELENEGIITKLGHIVYIKDREKLKRFIE